MGPDACSRLEPGACGSYGAFAVLRQKCRAIHDTLPLLRHLDEARGLRYRKNWDKVLSLEPSPGLRDIDLRSRTSKWS